MPNFIDIEGKKYPAVILGGDRFLGWFGNPPEHLKDVIMTEPYITSLMEKCYELGVRGFDMSVKEEVINSFKTIKAKYPDTVGIGNPNWKCGVHLNNKPLIDFSERIISTIYQKYFPDIVKADVKKLAHPGLKWFAELNAEPLTQEEIDAIDVDLETFQEKLNPLKGVCDFCLIGPNPIDCLIILDRLDIIEKLVKLVRDNGFIPLALAHLTSISIPKLEKLDFAGYWTWINRDFHFSNEAGAWKAINETKKPVTAMKVFAGGKLAEDIEGAIKYVKDKGINAVNLGVETEEQAEQTFTIAAKYF